ncbi:predicted protein [Thalassiosira pseudonana CCMP1335]|uniref:Sulfotransferase domain-containing protein n=1 Tax=Thalassiosira pseudonana TaxID=35128 RepID=B8C9M2_THAPS|nr:predicted protein [Thalassiosira pseudonana CCMP1335]EED90068.1 predicted protein [Thalassiosira pseudonana CCMP1335]
MKAIVLGTILFLCIVALITNSKYIRVQTNTIVSEQERGVTVSKGFRKKGGAEVQSSNAGDTEEEGDDSFDAGNEPELSSCFRARNDLALASHGRLPKPFINVGMPKMGSTSLHSFFCCGNYTSSHWECGKGKGLCADCMKRAVVKDTPPLRSCGNFDSWMQMDRDVFFPQIEMLNEIHNEAPNATYVLTFRDMNAWNNSLHHWIGGKNKSISFAERLTQANITGLPSGKGSNVDDLAEFFCNHVINIRNFVAEHPSHALVEIEMTDPMAGERLERIFGIKQSCWQQQNKNPVLHTEKSDKVRNTCYP